MRSYLHSTSERLDAIARAEEIREAKSRKQAAEELETDIQAAQARRTADTVLSSTPAAPAVASRLAADYRLLGLEPGTDLDTVEAAWRTLAQRADPKRFPAGSPEEKRAADILKSINQAYARIRESVNPTEGRFGRLEL